MSEFNTSAYVLTLTPKEFAAMKAAFKILNAAGIYAEEATNILIAAHRRRKVNEYNFRDQRRQA